MQQSKTVKKTITSTKSPVILVIDGQATAGIQIIGTYSGTLQFEGSLDGTNWSSILFKVPATGIESSSTTGTGIFVGSVAGLNFIRVRASALASGTPVVTIITSMSGSYNLTANADGNTKVTQATLLAGEDLTNDVMKVENRYSYTRLAADGQVKAGAGFIHTLTFACADAAPTAGSIIVYDSLTETGTVIYSETFDTTAFRGYSVLLDVSFATGCYVGFTTTADVGCTISYR